MTSRRVAFKTLGCKLNQYETDAMAAGFRALGWEVVEDGVADAYVVNTCTVTDRADRKSRKTLLRHCDPATNPIVVVTGCFAKSARESLEGQDGVTFVVPNVQKNQIPNLVDAHWRGEVAGPDLPAPDPFDFPAHERVFHTRASLKIQDGCDNFCSFCIIPSVRGRAVSRPAQAVLKAARELIAGGRKELVLTGVNMGRWNEGTARFGDLAADLLDLDGDFRLRITSLEPEGLDDAFADLFLHPKMAPHLHLCLQSGSPRILLGMRRDYSLDEYAAVVERLRRRRSDLNLTTDLIVGFPGETEADHSLSLEAITLFGFGAVHVFPYSRRQQTRAERMPDQVSEAVKAHRSREAQARAGHQRVSIMANLVGTTRTVLVETLDTVRGPRSWLRGLTEDYFPVRFQGPTPWNTFATVRLTGVSMDKGEPIFDASTD